MEEQRTVADELGDDLLNQLDSAENASNPIEQIKNRVDQDDFERGFSISRVPSEAHDDFKSLAKNMFANDYGMTLAFLIHYFKVTEQYQDRFNDAVDEITDRLDSIENQLDDGSTSKVSTVQ